MNDCVYHENLPPWIINTSVKSIGELRLIQWSLRISAILIMIIMAYLILEAPRQEYPWGLLLIMAIGFFLLIIGAENVTAKEIKSGSRIVIYNDYIEIPVTSIERLVKGKGIINEDNIKDMEILRYPIRQTVDKKMTVVWKDAPVELIIKTRDGKKFRTGAKYPPELFKMMNIIRDMWDVTIFDRGEGPGYHIPCK